MPTKPLIALVIVLLASTAGYGLYRFGAWRYDQGRAYEKSLRTEVDLTKSEDNRKTEAVVIEAKDKSYDEYIKARDAARADAASARTELGRLRDTVREYQRRARESATTECRTDGAAEVAGLLEESAERYESVAADATELAEQVIGLQGYIRSIFPICIRQGE